MPNDPLNLYAVLGLDLAARDELPSDVEVKEGWLQQLRIWHPDAAQGDTERSQQINLAFDVLETGP